MLTRELISKIRKIEIRTRRAVDEITGGAYRSVFKGRGMEFSEVREYTFEDDIRDIDWNVTARTGTAYIKKFTEERELTVILAVDVSASCAFGSRGTEKREKMAETAAVLALSAIRNHDKAGLLLFSGQRELFLPPRSGRSHVLRLIRELLACEPENHGTDLAAALSSLSRSLRKHAVVFLISDFNVPADFERELRILSRRHDVSLIRVTDRLEHDMPPLPTVNFRDAETGAEILFALSSKHRRARLKQTTAFLAEQISTLAARAGVDLVEIGADEELVRPLMKFFERRAKKRIR